jgi:hypothetical protein
MSTELEQLLRGGMERFTEDARVPDGLARKAYRHRQKRRMTTRVVTAAGTATVLTAGALAAAGVTGALGSAGGQPALTTTQIKADAYVFGRVEHALAAPSLDNAVGSTRTVYQPGTIVEPVHPAEMQVSVQPGVSSPWSVGYLVQWTYHGTTKFSAFTATGQRVFDLGITPGQGPGSIAVIYHDGTWWHSALRARPGPGAQPQPSYCGPEVRLQPGPGNGWPAFIRGELTCSEYAVDGRQWIGGIDAIKITGNKGLDTLWVSPATYLPVRAILTFGNVQIQTDFSWLAPTPANLAALNVTVPAGFQQVAPPPQQG